MPAVIMVCSPTLTTRFDLSICKKELGVFFSISVYSWGFFI